MAPEIQAGATADSLTDHIDQNIEAVVTTTIVLIAQNRQTKLEQQHTLGLQVNLLTEQKVTKLIHLIEELRHDLPMVKDRLDPQAEALQERADTQRVLSAIEQGGLTEGLLIGNRPADSASGGRIQKPG